MYLGATLSDSDIIIPRLARSLAIHAAASPQSIQQVEMLGSLLGSLVGTAGSASSASSATTPSPRSESPATSVSQDSTAPSTPAEPAERPAKNPPEGRTEEEEEEQADPFQQSAFFQRLKTKGRHHRNRIKEIQERALKDTPPKEPDPWECCGGSCGIECVVSPRPRSVSSLVRLSSECADTDESEQVTMWWEEEKTWRDLRPDWREIKQRLKDEEEDRQREAEEEAAIAGPPAAAGAVPTPSPTIAPAKEPRKAGTPTIEIALEDETQQKLAL